MCGFAACPCHVLMHLVGHTDRRWLLAQRDPPVPRAWPRCIPTAVWSAWADGPQRVSGHPAGCR